MHTVPGKEVFLRVCLERLATLFPSSFSVSHNLTVPSLEAEAKKAWSCDTCILSKKIKIKFKTDTLMSSAIKRYSLTELFPFKRFNKNISNKTCKNALSCET